MLPPASSVSRCRPSAGRGAGKAEARAITGEKGGSGEAAGKEAAGAAEAIRREDEAAEEADTRGAKIADAEC